MPNSRITVPLTSEERNALLQIADRECRDPREELRFLLRQEAQRRGLMTQADTVQRARLGQTGDAEQNTTIHK